MQCATPHNTKKPNTHKAYRETQQTSVKIQNPNLTRTKQMHSTSTRVNPYTRARADPHMQSTYTLESKARPIDTVYDLPSVSWPVRAAKKHNTHAIENITHITASKRYKAETLTTTTEHCDSSTTVTYCRATQQKITNPETLLPVYFLQTARLPMPEEDEPPPAPLLLPRL